MTCSYKKNWHVPSHILAIFRPITNGAKSGFRFLTLLYIFTVNRLYLQYPTLLFEGCFHSFKNSLKYCLFSQFHQPDCTEIVSLVSKSCQLCRSHLFDYITNIVFDSYPKISETFHKCCQLMTN